nr:MAG TPA: hypothetical protein [Caudoviricetes sp.]
MKDTVVILLVSKYNKKEYCLLDIEKRKIK